MPPEMTPPEDSQKKQNMMTALIALLHLRIGFLPKHALATVFDSFLIKYINSFTIQRCVVIAIMVGGNEKFTLPVSVQSVRGTPAAGVFSW
jgi:hypothetical protein